ncbi:unnamed protein product [Ectocarpus sp. 4 AP-2014]
MPCFTDYRTAAVCNAYAIVPRDMGPWNEYRSRVAEEPFLISPCSIQRLGATKWYQERSPSTLMVFMCRRGTTFSFTAGTAASCCFRNRRLVYTSGKSTVVRIALL